MVAKHTHPELEAAIKAVGTKVDEGFLEVHRRLDEGSEKFALHNGKIQKITSWRDNVTGALKLAGYLLPVIISALALIAVFWKG